VVYSAAVHFLSISTVKKKKLVVICKESTNILTFSLGSVVETETSKQVLGEPGFQTLVISLQ